MDHESFKYFSLLWLKEMLFSSHKKTFSEDATFTTTIILKLFKEKKDP